MSDLVQDGFDSYYSERLWQLLPSIYRTADTDSLVEPGPLRELLNRIGGQMAVVRRSIDRLWADQSIETCDDWVIPYIGALLGTNLVDNLDPSRQRVDVAKTIHYRRRKGTLPVLEELAQDITGWTAHVVEAFRRLARTRHGLDPAVGPGGYPSTDPTDLTQLLQIEGLEGLLTGGLAGGYADLRSLHGAGLADSPFDESFHMADMRIGQGALGHFGIPKLLVFLWRLTSFQAVESTPVQVPSPCVDQFVFDPLGRQLPLFMPQQPPADDFADVWTPSHEWGVPGPLTTSLWEALYPPSAPTPPPSGQIASPPAPPYPDPLQPTPSNPDPPYLVPTFFTLNGGPTLGQLWPELGQFSTTATPPAGFTVSYFYGFSSNVGAGPYNRDLLGSPPPVVLPETKVPLPQPDLVTALTDLPATGTVTINDSLTYRAVENLGTTTPFQSVLVRAGIEQRPVLRGTGGGATWIFTGAPGAALVLDGLTVSGMDVVLRGAFASVRITACTFDPGTGAATAPPGQPLATAVDGQLLAPTALWVEADPNAPAGSPTGIQSLEVDRSILGPVRTRFGGSVETLSISDSIVQGLTTTAAVNYSAANIYDPLLLARALTADDPLSTSLISTMGGAAVTADLQAYITTATASPDTPLPATVVTALNAVVNGASLWANPALFNGMALSSELQTLTAEAATLSAGELAVMNRGLLDAAYSVALGVAAIAVADATVQLTRVTVLGPMAAHRLQVSDSIMKFFVAVDDTQDGCVRFTAYTSDSSVPRQYESVVIGRDASLFTSEDYGQPGYAQLLDAADAAVLAPAGGSVLTGADNGSEMGAFSADGNPVKEQGLLIKYDEYMPLGLTPVIVHVT